jgi:hypothetical protein
VTTIADLLGTRDRQLLERLARPPEDTQALAIDARESAAESSGTGRCAWLVTACALKAASSTGEAREVLAEMLPAGELRTLALGCLSSICNDPQEEDASE